MAYRLYLTIQPTPAEEEIPSLRRFLEASFPHKDNLPYLDALYGSPDHPAMPRVTAERLGALSLLPSLLEAADLDFADLILRRDEHGRPYCAASDGIPVGFDFNLSHSASHIAGALLVGEGKVGVDVEEFIPPKRALPLIRRFCTEGELALLDGLPRDEELAARFFTSTWVEKEAIAKQEGGGMPLRFDTANLPDGIMLWSGHLPETETAVALCAPLQNAPAHPRLLSASLPVLFQ
jgi:phosphopantetheinyl transferase